MKPIKPLFRALPFVYYGNAPRFLKNDVIVFSGELTHQRLLGVYQVYFSREFNNPYRVG